MQTTNTNIHTNHCAHRHTRMHTNKDANIRAIKVAFTHTSKKHKQRTTLILKTKPPKVKMFSLHNKTQDKKTA